MTQTAPAPRHRPKAAAAPPPPSGAVAPYAPPVVAPGAAPAPASGLRTTTRLRVAMAVGVVAALLVAVLGWQAGSRQAAALHEVQTRSTWLVGVQQVRNALVAADATATTTFLVGGLEPADQRARYDEYLTQAADGLVTVASGDKSATASLAGVSADLTTYAGLIEQARAANRQGLPVGTAYLDQASTLLRAQMLPALDAVVLTGADEVASGFGAVSNAPWLLFAVLAGLLVLLVVHIGDARRTHRVLNPPLTAAALLVLVAGVYATGLLSVSSSAQDTRTGSYRATLAVSQATASAYDARAMESFTLIRRGSGAAYEAKFVTAADETTRQLGRVPDGSSDTTTQLFEVWRALHGQVRQLDDGGNWDGAVALVVGTATDSPAAAFDAFAQSAAADLQASTSATEQTLTDDQGRANRIGWVLAGAGLLAAVLTWRGLARRLEEYR